MATGPRYKVPMKRRRYGKTNYHNRLSLLISERDRIVVRKSTKGIIIQFIKHNSIGDQTFLSSISSELSKYGYNYSKSNIPAAYLTGLLFGYKSIDNGYTSGILDIGLHPSTKGSKIYAALKGMVDAGLVIPHETSVFPDEDKINGNIISEYHNKKEIHIEFENAKENIISDFR